MGKKRFFPFIKRSETNVRLFDDNDLEWVRIVKCLRVVGVENNAVKRYVDLCIKGDSTIPDVMKLLKKQKLKRKIKLKS